jgi:hypothetical protein
MSGADFPVKLTNCAAHNQRWRGRVEGTEVFWG